MKIEAQAFIKNGKLFIVDRVTMDRQVNSMKDVECTVTIDTDTQRKTRKQRGYYWSTLVPHTLIILRDICGYSEYQTTDDAHEFLKYWKNPVFRKNPETGKEERFGGSTKKMKKGEAVRYIDDIILGAFDQFNYTYPPPKKGQEKYFIE